MLYLIITSLFKGYLIILTEEGSMSASTKKHLFIAAIALIAVVALGMIYSIITDATATPYHFAPPLLLIMAAFFFVLYAAPNHGKNRPGELKGPRADTDLGQLLTAISHEVKTPMIGILGSVDLLEQGAPEPHQLEHLHTIRTCSDDLLAVLDAVLNVAKIELNEPETNLTPCHVRLLLTRTLENVGPLLQSKGIKVQLQIDEELPDSIILDEGKLQQILGYILNSLIQSARKGPIIIAAGLNSIGTDEHLLIRIEDSASGIATPEQADVLLHCQQANGSIPLVYKETGLFLYVCQRLLESMGGSIRIESRADTGTDVYIEVPFHKGSLGVKAEENQAPQKPDTADDSCLCFEPAGILLVEDNPLSQRIIFQMLDNYGFRCRVVNNGLECLTALQREPFDAVLLDMQMPVMDGYETAEAIRQDAGLKDLAVIAMTAHSMVGDREKCVASGCTDYISKPFKSRDLIEIIIRHLPVNDKGVAEQVDSLLISELMPDLLEMLCEMIGSLQSAWCKKDLDEIQSLSHDVKGTAGMYGLTAISSTAGKLEKAAREYDYQSIAVLMHVLQDQYHQSHEQFMGRKIALS